MDVFARVCKQKAGHFKQACDNIQPYDKRRFSFCQMIFRLFFWKLPQFHTSNFCKAVRQHTKGMVGSDIWVLLEIYLTFQQQKNFENLLRIYTVIAMSLVYYFFGNQCTKLFCSHFVIMD